LMHYFSSLGGMSTVPQKARRDTELGFMHPVGSAGHVVHCSASGV
jgi:hypothetical protein